MAHQANSRIYVEEDIADAFLEKFKTHFGTAQLGDPLDEKTTLGYAHGMFPGAYSPRF